jgi:hypothetical protein
LSVGSLYYHGNTIYTPEKPSKQLLYQFRNGENGFYHWMAQTPKKLLYFQAESLNNLQEVHAFLYSLHKSEFRDRFR